MKPRSRRRLRRQGKARGKPPRLENDSNGSVPTGRANAPNGLTGAVWQRRERERPAASVIWQTVAIAMIGFAFALALAALTLADSMDVRASNLWIGAVGFALLAITCLLAHWDVNRGRKTRYVEIEERSTGEEG